MENIKLKQQVSTLVKENSKLREQIKICKEEQAKSYLNATDAVKHSFSGKLTSSQINSIVSGRPVTRWSEEEIGTAVTLRSLSTKTYNYLRTKMLIPLPSRSTINRYVSKLSVEPGLLESIIRILGHQSQSMNETDRICALSMDEMSVCKEWTYDRAMDKIYGPKNNVLCVMIRGVVSKWKQLIFYDFDVDMSKDTLFQIIHKVESAGFIVVSLVNDLCPTNVRLWKSLGISTTSTSFPNPAAPDRPVFVLADPPHLIKLVRNNLLDSGFQLQGDKRVSSDCLRELIVKGRKDLKPTHRLSLKHVDVHGVKRMNVKLAVQLLSETTSKALSYFGGKNLLECKTWKDTSELIYQFDSWFDLLNSRKPTDSKRSRNAFGLDLVKQIDVLEKMKETAKTMRVGSYKFLLPFQKGLIISSTSLIKLHQHLKDKYGINYIMTHRLNQDVLENFFGCLRQIGGTTNQHPNPVQVKHRIRSYLLGRNTDFLGCKAINESCTKDNSLVSSVSEVPLPENESCQTENQNLDDELTLSAMVFASDDLSHLEEENDDLTMDELRTVVSVEEELGREGIIYFGGFIVKKFPHYPFLGQQIGTDENNWLGAICRFHGKLMKPSDKFLAQLKKMEACFNIFHGVNSLKPGKNSVQSLTSYLETVVDVPTEVIAYFIRCRVFFRIRELNRKNQIASTKKKVLKIVK